MINDCWKILGIEPTDNKREVRAAYAAKCKQYHIEEDPEQFATLNQAYQAALAYAAKQNTKAPDQPQEPISGIPKRLPKEEIHNEIQDTQQTSPKEPPHTSLLARLQQAEDTQIQQSLTSGALKQFTAIFETAKETGKVPKADVWKTFFLSEEFLKEQHEEGFAKGMLQYLSEWSMEGNYNGTALPSPFLMELAIAYGLLPERVGNNFSGKNQYQVSASGSFYGRECAAALWNQQQSREYFPIRLLYKPENLVRLRSFSDYLRLRALNQNHLLTPANQDSWERILMCGRINHMYERKGKGQHDIYEETRSVCLIALYRFWIQDDKVPACVLEYMYKEYELQHVERSSAKNLYGPLKQEILKTHPDIEAALFGDESRKQMESQWYRELTKIISDNHTNYDKGIYNETEEIQTRVQQLFTRPEWEQIQDSQNLFEKLFSQLYKRMVVPESLAQRLIEHYSQENSRPDSPAAKGENAGKCSILIETLIQSIAFKRRIQDARGLKPAGCSKTGVEEISDDNRDFWYYYLMAGYGFRCADMEFGADAQADRAYALGSKCYLPLYIQYTYYPSLYWRKQFVGYQDRQDKPIEPFAGQATEERAEQCRQQSQPESEENYSTIVEFKLPDGKELKVEFHLHYCLYFLEGKQVLTPEYTFEQFAEMAPKLEKTEHFFFLLAITEIGKEHWTLAERLIEERLSRLILYPSTIPMIARLLAEGTEELVQASSYDGQFQYNQKAAPVNRTHTPKAAPVLETKNPEVIEDIYYSEQDSDCFRMLVTDRTIHLYHKRTYGWHELPLPGMCAQPENLSLNERRVQARETLRQLVRPRPVSLGAISLEGMETEEKAQKVMELLQTYEEYRRRENDWSPSAPTADAPVLKNFFQKEGRFLTESYCVLRFGPKQEQECVFYCGIFPYAFQTKEQNPDAESSYQFRCRELERKIKEKHWLLGNFAWESIHGLEQGLEPAPFAVGESGTYYYFDVFRMHRADSLTALLAKLFDFSEVTQAEVYQGCLAFSRLDHKAVYCFGEEELRSSLYSPYLTPAELFVRFTGAGRKQEFARWANEILARTDRLCHPLFVLEQHKENLYSLSLYDYKKFHFESAPAPLEHLSAETCRLVWKMDRMRGGNRLDELGELVLWYMEYGSCGWKLKNCLKVEAAEFTLRNGRGQPSREENGGRFLEEQKTDGSWRQVQELYFSPALSQSLCETGRTPEHLTRLDGTIFENKTRLFQAVMERTAMKAYSLSVVCGKMPELFDSKIGGLPYWEPGKEYPQDSQGTKLALLAQINLDRSPMTKLIPGGGMLQFFGAADKIFSRDFGSREDQELYRVVYHPQVNYDISREILLACGLPDSTDCYAGHTPVLKECLLEAEAAEVYMSVKDYRFAGELKTALKETFGIDGDPVKDLFYGELEELLEEDETFCDVVESISSNGLWLLGYPAFASNQKDPRGEQQALRQYDRLLFQFDVHALDDSYYLDSEHDCGVANFFIRSEDLAKLEFGRVMYHWECCEEDRDEDDEEEWDEDEENWDEDDEEEWDEDEDDWDEKN